MLKVLHIRSSFNPGGTETLLKDLYNFNQQRIKLYYAFIKNGSYISQLKSTKNQYILAFRKHKFDIRLIRSLINIIKSERIKRIHTHQEIELFYAALIKLLYPGIKIFHHVHLHNPKKNWEYYLERSLTRFTQRTFVVSAFLNCMLIKKGYQPAKLTVLYNAVNNIDKCLVNQQNLEQLKKRIKFQQSDFIVGMVGNFVPEKDQLSLVKAYHLHLRDKFPQIKIVFIGKESKLMRDCRRFLNDSDVDHRVFFLGSMEHAAQYLNLFDLFVMSSKNETFNIAIIEALLSKIPVLASNIDVFRELSQNGKYFQLFEVGDIADLANQVARYVNKDTDKLDKNKIDSAYHYALENFSYESYIEKLVHYYNN